VTDKLAVTVTWVPERGGYVGTASDLPGGGPVVTLMLPLMRDGSRRC
jgi:hypothetical protein